MFLFRPQPVYAIDMPLIGLRTAELFALCSLRLWVLDWRDRDAMPPDWRSGFAAARIGGLGVAAFDDMLGVVATAATCSLDVRCPKCIGLGEDEGWFLQLLSLLQRDRLAEAAAILRHWLPPGAVRIATGPAQTFAAALAAAGLAILPRHAEAARSTAGAPLPHDACGSALVH